MKRKKNNILVFALLCASLIAQAQDRYLSQSKLSSTQGEGFYRVLLNPAITAASESDYHDLRIVDSAGHYVPYLIHTESPVSRSQEFRSFTFTIRTDSLFTIQVENPSTQPCSSLWLTLRNTALSNETFLSGSDDGATWFDITSDIMIYSSRVLAADSFEQRISFTPVSYRHLRLSMRRTKFTPLNVIRVGTYESLTTSGHYSAIRAPQITQKDSNKVSYVTLYYDAAYHFDRLTLSITAPRLYHRSATIYSIDSAGRSLVGEYTLSSAEDNALDLSVKTKTLLIEINNQDNPPLSISGTEALQLNRYATMYLTGDRSYYLVFGNTKAIAPVYDISYFEDSIRAHSPTDLTTGPISANSIIPNTQSAITHAEANGLHKKWIWPVLIAVLAILLFFTLRMGKEVSKEA